MHPLTYPRPAILPFLIALVFIYFASWPTARAVVPAPDGGYPGGNTAEGQNALLSLTSGQHNTAVGFLSLKSDTTGGCNTAVGSGTLFSNTADANTATGCFALLSNTGGAFNTATGAVALFSNTAGVNNTASGAYALSSNMTGSNNTANGYQALASNTTGSGNVALGAFAGANLTTGNSNIDIGTNVFAQAGETNTIRIGSGQFRAFIAGIRGKTTGNADAIPVLIDSAGQLGTASSSRRFKHHIKPMHEASEAILALKPVTFHYNSDKTAMPQFGLIAEEVAEVNPDLVVRDENGAVYTVRYDAVNAMLLNEFLKEHRRNEEQQCKLQEQEGMITRQQKQINALSATLQKVSAQLELRESAPQTVLNNQ